MILCFLVCCMSYIHIIDTYIICVKYGSFIIRSFNIINMVLMNCFFFLCKVLYEGFVASCQLNFACCNDAGDGGSGRLEVCVRRGDDKSELHV